MDSQIKFVKFSNLFILLHAVILLVLNEAVHLGLNDLCFNKNASGKVLKIDIAGKVDKFVYSINLFFSF